MAIPRSVASVGLVDLHLLAVEEDLALVSGVDAGDGLDHRRLPRAVVAHQGNDLTVVDLEVDVGERLDGTEALAHPLQGEHGGIAVAFHVPAPLGDRATAPGGARGGPGATSRSTGCRPPCRRQRTCPCRSRCGFQNPSLTMVSLMLSTVTATGSSRTDGDLLLAVVDLAVDEAARRLLALGERHGQLRRRLGLGLDRLVDRHVLLAGEDPLDGRQLGVLTRGRDASSGRCRALHGGDGAAGGAVVGGVDADEAVLAERGDRLLHLLLRLVRAPVRRVVLLGHLYSLASMTLCAPSLNSLALLSVGAPLIITMIRPGAVLLQLLREALALQLADLLVVERDVVVDVGVGDQAVVADDRDLRLLGPGHDDAGGGRVDRVEHEHLRALRDAPPRPAAAAWPRPGRRSSR